MTSHPDLISGTTTNEGCTLHYTTIPPPPGTSPPLLLFIPGGAGHSTQFLTLLPHMLPDYQPATFSRRQHGLSTPLIRNNHVQLNPCQQVRDVLAVVDGSDKQPFSIFASSGGAIIALHLAAMYPARVRQLVAHEPPLVTLLPDYYELLEFFFKVQALYVTEGWEAAMELFQTRMVGYEGVPRLGGEGEGDVERFVRFEMMGFAIPPDLEGVREGFRRGKGEGKGRVVMAVGRESRDAFYARSARRAAEVLGCECVEMTGNHTGWRYETEVFAGELRGVLEAAGGSE
ncbi:hypothetical protein AJ79_02242 [Helicocarpus griseus UAMH5409]|uniref:AB hydrolase-1 domain-containing protein n=1 Tax=Helicocarpus griseus UAMH5409 TaxID=1447875 RepID=A0A2B7Y489_9EURO|nr:hypothetical protein AJ79_02242 [Helicocarpus griseus UAMH5409]